MKKVLLFDNELMIIEHILKETDWIISVLITSKNIAGLDGYSKNVRVEAIFFEEDFWLNTDLEYISYSELRKYWYAQLKIENGCRRKIDDYQLTKMYYYRGIAKALKIFQENDIDLVIIKGLNHGFPFDRMLVEIANNKNITSYNLESMVCGKRIIYNNKKNDLVKVIDTLNIDRNNDIMVVQNVDEYQAFGRICQPERSYPLKNIIKNVIYAIFGEVGVELIICIVKRNLNKDIFGVGILEKLKNRIKLLRLERYLEKVGKKFDREKKYIYFSLHREPEATVSGRALLDSQLILLQMLSNVIPEDWVIYVKEHPDQFKANRRFFYSFIYSASIYRSKYFYDEISKMKNVILLKTNEPVQDILDGAKAIATMSGTVILEAIKLNKKVIAFSTERTIYRHIKDIINVESYNDCCKAIEIVLSNHKVDYSELDDVLNMYLFNNDSDGFKNAVLSIKYDIGERFVNA